MKKKISAMLTSVFAIIVTIVCLTVNVAAYEQGSIGIDDQAELYTAEQLAELEARQQEVAEHTGWNIAVVTTSVGFGEDGYNAIEYAEKYYDEKFGYTSSGILYLIDLDYRHFCISGTADYEYFNDTRVNAMFKQCNDRYMDYDDVGNLNAFYDNVIAYYDAGPFPESNYVYGKSVFNIGVALVVGLIAAAIGIGVVVSRYKFHYTPTANNYLDGGRVNFYRRSDRFIREFTTRTKIESSSSGGGGGGHGSSGGHSHGGGGGGGRR